MSAGQGVLRPFARGPLGCDGSRCTDSRVAAKSSSRAFNLSLGQEVARWCDVIVGDYNHFFDSSALLHGLVLANSWRVGLLADEAHNLVDRARAMYSASLNAAQLRAVRVSAPPALKKPLDRLYRRWTRLVKESPEQYTVLDEPPRTLTSALQDATSVITEHLAAYPAGVDSGLLQFYFDALQFTRLLDTFGTHSIFDITRESEGTGAGRRTMSSTLCIRNVVPASFLKPRFAAARSTVLFSATLTPWNFYADMLGLPDDTAWLDVPAPFSAEQLSVRIVSHVSTRYQHRTRSLAPIGRIIARQYAAAPGNYIAFLSSFEYLEQAADAFSLMHPDVPTWHQGPRMGESEREAFLGRFLIDGRGVGFAVLGGSFAEGIDLVGTRLVGAFIATLGLPQFNPVNKELRRRLAAKFGAGYDYTYLFPGIRKRWCRQLGESSGALRTEARCTSSTTGSLGPRCFDCCQRGGTSRRNVRMRPALSPVRASPTTSLQCPSEPQTPRNEASPRRNSASSDGCRTGRFEHRAGRRRLGR